MKATMKLDTRNPLAFALAAVLTILLAVLSADTVLAAQSERNHSRPATGAAGEIEVFNIPANEIFYYDAAHLLLAAYEAVDGDEIRLAAGHTYHLDNDASFITPYGNEPGQGNIPFTNARFGLYFLSPKTVSIIGDRTTIVNSMPTTTATPNGGAAFLGFQNMITTTNNARVTLRGVTLDAGGSPSSHIINASTGVVTLDRVTLKNVNQCWNPIVMTTQPYDVANNTAPTVSVAGGGLDIHNLAPKQAIFSAGTSGSFNTNAAGLTTAHLPKISVALGAGITSGGRALPSSTVVVLPVDKVKDTFWEQAKDTILTDANLSPAFDPTFHGLNLIATADSLIVLQGPLADYVRLSSAQSDTVYFTSLYEAIDAANANPNDAKQTIAVAGHIVERTQKSVTAHNLTITSINPSNPASVTFTAPANAPANADTAWLNLAGDGITVSNLSLTAADSYVTHDNGRQRFASSQMDPTILSIQADDVSISNCFITAGAGSPADDEYTAAGYAIQIGGGVNGTAIQNNTLASGGSNGAIYAMPHGSVAILGNTFTGDYLARALTLHEATDASSVVGNTFATTSGSTQNKCQVLYSSYGDSPSIVLNLIDNTFIGTNDSAADGYPVIIYAYTPAAAGTSGGIAGNVFLEYEPTITPGGNAAVLGILDRNASSNPAANDLRGNQSGEYHGADMIDSGLGYFFGLTYMVKGTLAFDDGKPPLGVPVTFTPNDAAASTVTTSAKTDGTFALLLPENASGLVSVPAHANYTLSPADGHAIAGLNAGIDNCNFAYTRNRFLVRGTVSGLRGQSASVHCIADGDAYASVAVDSDSTFAFSDIPSGSTVVLTPQALRDYIVSPKSIAIPLLRADSTVGNHFEYMYAPTQIIAAADNSKPSPTPEETETSDAGQTTDNSPVPPTPGTSGKPYMNGYPDGTIRPSSPMTRAEFAAILFNLYGNDEVFPKAAASDAQNHWALPFIAFAKANGFMGGYPDGTFRPDQPITRAEAATVLAKVKQPSDYTDSGRLNDISHHWAKHSISALANAGILSGYPDGTFRPDAPVTRAEAVVMLNRLESRSGFAFGKTFRDLAPDFWAYSDMMNAANGS